MILLPSTNFSLFHVVSLKNAKESLSLSLSRVFLCLHASRHDLEMFSDVFTYSGLLE